MNDDLRDPIAYAADAAWLEGVKEVNLGNKPVYPREIFQKDSYKRKFLAELAAAGYAVVDTDAPLWLVYSREHNAFWRPNAAGYTWDINTAGRYTREQAEQHCGTRDHRPDRGPPEVAVIAPEAMIAAAEQEQER